MDQLNVNLADFSLNLMRDVGLNSSNLFCSPLSITIALAMTLAGTGGNTKKQLKSVVFGVDTKEKTIHSAFSNIMSDILALPTSQKDADKCDQPKGAELPRVYIANKLFPSKMIMKLHKFYRSYLDRLRNTYKIDGDLPVLDYADSASAAKVINDWVSEKTFGKIKDIVKEESLDGLTAAVLVNAIYFKGPWLNPFPKFKTSNENFYTSESDIGTPVRMMKHDNRFPHYSDPKGQFNLALLPYTNPNFSMFVILPTARDGVNEDLKSLRGNELLGAISKAQLTRLKLWLPKFKLEFKLPLKPALTRMGVKDMFDDRNADFSRMSSANLYVSEVQHKAVVEVDEYGTEAAAATAVIMSVKSGAVDFKVDHPFLFGIWEKRRNQIYFLGKLSNPN